MGVQNLWKALSKGGAVEVLDGSQKGHHARIVDAVDNRVVAVDLSAWLMQAQTQPALLEHYDSPYARAVKVVFDRTIHWLRYGCLPVFVIEGRTPAAKLDKLRARCVAQYGRAAYAYYVGNREGGQFDRLGQAVKGLLDALGVPCVQAVGEAEAMCAAFNVCGWAHAVHTADVDAHLFGALTVYKQVHLQTDDPRRSVLARCCMYDVRRVLGITRGGDAALMAVAHLTGGDYDMGGADNVGEVLALGAVRQLLLGCEDDEQVLEKLEAAVARGPDPELDALTCCTGCKACGHEGGRKSKIKAHSARNGCDACGCEDGCQPREWTECKCAFHARADERLLNRVVRRAAATPGFVDGFRTAASTYAEQTRSAIAFIQREYGLPAPNGRNVFSWAHRPDVRAVSGIMCKYIKDWDYRQVRLKLLPLLLEWDVRQGPSAGPSLVGGVQFRPTSIRKVSSKGAEAAELIGVPTSQQQGWRYVLQVDRLADSSTDGTAAAADTAANAAEDLAIDQSWVAGTARSRAPKQGDASAAAAAAGQTPGKLPASQQQQGGLGGGSSSDPLLLDDDGYEAEPYLATQLPGGQAASSPWAAGRRPSSSSRSPAQGQLLSQVGSQAAGSGGASGRGGSSGTLQFAEHRSVRCSLIDTLWPHLTAKLRQPAASGGRSRSGGAARKKKQDAAAAAGGNAGADAAAAAAGDKQCTVKDFFGVAKDYTAPGRQPTKRAAAAGGTIPGLAGLVPGAAGSTPGRRGPPPAAAAAAEGAAGAAGAAAAATAGSMPGVSSVAKVAPSTARRAPQQSFMEWLEGQTQEALQEQKQQQQQWELPGSQSSQGLQQQQQGGGLQQQQLLQPQQQPQQQRQLKSSSIGGRPLSAKQASLGAAAAAAAAGRRGGSSVSSRGRRKHAAAAKTPCKSGPLDRFLRPAAASPVAVVAAAAAGASGPERQQADQQALLQQAEQQPQDLQEQDMQQDLQEQQQQQPWPAQLLQQCSQPEESPEVPSLAARLAAAAAAGAATTRASRGAVAPNRPHHDRGRSRSDSDNDGDGDDGSALLTATAAGAAGEAAEASAWMAPPPAKKASTPKAQELLSSPLKAAAAAGGPTAAARDVQASGGSPPPAAAAYSAQYQSLLQQLGVASPDQQQPQQQPGRRLNSSRAAVVKGLFGPQQQQQQAMVRPSGVMVQSQEQPDCIELLDSPLDPRPVNAAPAPNSKAVLVAAAAGGASSCSFEVVDLTFSPS